MSRWQGDGKELFSRHVNAGRMQEGLYKSSTKKRHQPIKRHSSTPQRTLAILTDLFVSLHFNFSIIMRELYEEFSSCPEPDALKPNNLVSRPHITHNSHRLALHFNYKCILAQLYAKCTEYCLSRQCILWCIWTKMFNGYSNKGLQTIRLNTIPKECKTAVCPNAVGGKTFKGVIECAEGHLRCDFKILSRRISWNRSEPFMSNNTLKYTSTCNCTFFM